MLMEGYRNKHWGQELSLNFSYSLTPIHFIIIKNGGHQDDEIFVGERRHKNKNGSFPLPSIGNGNKVSSLEALGREV